MASIHSPAPSSTGHMNRHDRAARPQEAAGNGLVHEAEAEGGSNLLGAIESVFAVIFRVKTRDFLPQKLMSVLMVLLFAVLLPLSFVSSFLLSAASTTLSRIIPGTLSGPFAIVLGLVTGLA